MIKNIKTIHIFVSFRQGQDQVLIGDVESKPLGNKEIITDKVKHINKDNHKDNDTMAMTRHAMFDAVATSELL